MVDKSEAKLADPLEGGKGRRYGEECACEAAPLEVGGGPLKKKEAAAVC